MNTIKSLDEVRKMKEKIEFMDCPRFEDPHNKRLYLQIRKREDENTRGSNRQPRKKRRK